MNPVHDFQKSSRLVLLLACMALPLLFEVPSSIPLVHAAGILYVGPPQQGPFTVGTTITYQVNVTSMDPFNGWDIYVNTNSSVLNPLSISVAGNLLGSVNEFANCINVRTDGTAKDCTSKDSPAPATA